MWKIFILTAVKCIFWILWPVMSVFICYLAPASIGYCKYPYCLFYVWLSDVCLHNFCKLLSNFYATVTQETLQRPATSTLELCATCAVHLLTTSSAVGDPQTSQIFAYGKWLYPYRMLLHGASDLDRRCLKTRSSKDGCTFPPNIFAFTPKIPFWVTFQQASTWGASKFFC